MINLNRVPNNPINANLLLPQGMNDLQGGNFYQPQSLQIAMEKQPVTLPTAQNPSSFQLNPYNIANITTPAYDRRMTELLQNYPDKKLIKINSDMQNSNGQINFPDTQPPYPIRLLSAPQPTTEQPAQNQMPSQVSTNTPTATTPVQNPATTPSPEKNPQAENQAVTDAIKNLQNAQPNLANYNSNTQSEDKIKLRTYPQRGSVPTTLLPNLNRQEYLDADSMQTLNSLYVAKNLYQNYDDIQQKAAEKLAEQDLSAKDRLEWQKTYDNAVQIKENAANYGHMARQNLLQFGINSEDYGLGSGNTYDEATQAINFLHQRDMRHFLNLPSSKEMERQRQQEYMDAGLGRSWARYLAREDREEINRELSGQYLGAMQTYGLNSDGSLNNYGFALASKWAKDDPTSANLYLQGYATPNAQYQAQNTLLNNIVNNDSATQRHILSILANQEHQDKNIEARLEMLQQTQDWQGDQNNQNRAIQWANLDLRQKQLELNAEKAANELVLKNQEMWNKSPEGKVYQATILGRYLGYDGDELSEFVMAQFKQIPNAEKRKTAYNEFDTASADIEKLIKDGEFEKAKESIDALYNRIRDFGSDFKYVSLDDREIWAGMIDVYTKAANKEYKPGEFDKLMYDFKNRTKSPAGNGDQYMAELMNNPARVKGIYEQYKKWGIPSFKGNMAEQILKFSEYSPYYGSSLSSTFNTNAANTGYGVNR